MRDISTCNSLKGTGDTDSETMVYFASMRNHMKNLKLKQKYGFHTLSTSVLVLLLTRQKVYCSANLLCIFLTPTIAITRQGDCEWTYDVRVNTQTCIYNLIISTCSDLIFIS